jgi:hypothetical protein
MVYLQINTVKFYFDREIMNRSNSLFHAFANICLYLVKFENIQSFGIIDI